MKRDGGGGSKFDLIVNIFFGIDIFSSGVEKLFLGGGVEKLLGGGEGLRDFGGLRNFRGGLGNFRGD